MSTSSQCTKRACNTVVQGTVCTCPDCGARMIGSSSNRFFGWVMTGIGGLIAVPMAFVLAELLPRFLNPEAALPQHTGGMMEDVPLATLLLVLVFVFGASLLGFGLHRAVTGRRNGAAIKVLGLLGMVFLGMFFYVGSKLS